MNKLLKTIENFKIIPVVVLKKIEECEPLLDNLFEGGLPIAEITFRTACAPDCIKLASKKYKNAIIGAGTVINAKQAKEAVDCGAKFIVGPGFSKEVANFCKDKVLYIPGCVTPTEIITAISCGIDIIKFFPANLYGGIKALKTFASVFPSVKFVPTGGIGIDNLKEYLELKNVFAIGGSWMTSGSSEEVLSSTKAAVLVKDSIVKA